MMPEHDNNQPLSATRTPSGASEKNARRAIKAARSTRLRRRLKPFNELDAEVVALIKRLTPDADTELGTNVARTILQAQTLRKELLLGKLKAEELDTRLEEHDVREEWERVKRELGISA
jgi:hypothetical protein